MDKRFNRIVDYIMRRGNIAPDQKGYVMMRVALYESTVGLDEVDRIRQKWEAEQHDSAC